MNFLRLYLIASSLVLIGCSSDKNSKLEYGDSGLPKNCRAIIAANVAAWKNKTYSAQDVLESIDRNCGANGHSW